MPSLRVLATAEPLGDEPMIFFPAFRRIVPPKGVILAVDTDDAKVFRLVVAVLGASTTLGHVRHHSFRKVVPILLRNSVNGRTAQRRQVR